VKRKELVKYLLEQGYEYKNANVVSKKYKIKAAGDFVPNNTVTIEYTFKKSMLDVYYVFVNKSIKRFKARTKNLNINKDGQLVGLKSLDKD